MHRILITGAGKIGSTIACLLAQSGDYEIIIADQDFSHADVKCLQAQFDKIQEMVLDVNDDKAFADLIQTQKPDAIISSLPYFLNVPVAKMAKQHGLHYFDLTEDTRVTQVVSELAEGASTAFVPQCGLAPGFISIVANNLMQHFDDLDEVKLRVGALPQHTSNALHYALTWSTEGVINEYGNACHGIISGEAVLLPPLEGLESIKIDGLNYEAFNTSGGLGSLAQTYAGKIQHLTYKTMRYPGHCEKMRVLMNDLKLNQDRDTLKRILENAIPKITQDVVNIYVSVTGTKAGQYVEENYQHKVYPQNVASLQWSAIQITTAAGICAVADIVLNNPKTYNGLVLQEQIDFNEFLKSQFGQYYAK